MKLRNLSLIWHLSEYNNSNTLNLSVFSNWNNTYLFLKFTPKTPQHRARLYTKRGKMRDLNKKEWPWKVICTENNMYVEHLICQRRFTLPCSESFLQLIPLVCRSKFVFVKWICSLLEAPQSRLWDNRCIDLKYTVCLLCRPSFWGNDSW